MDGIECWIQILLKNGESDSLFVSGFNLVVGRHCLCCNQLTLAQRNPIKLAVPCGLVAVMGAGRAKQIH